MDYCHETIRSRFMGIYKEIGELLFQYFVGAKYLKVSMFRCYAKVF
ncbi:hypothetical protein CI610_00720 [invertebrate metagenome]|uniref:Uncharacterized protein n=1 Tax=invertebrate metagenome TaxID=1711999 RepID=A0A2H9TAP2_9ZZZZ